MSLINEALKKARLEASRRAGERQGLPLPEPGLFAARGDLRPAIVIGVAALVVVLGAGIFFAGRRSAATASGPAPETLPAAAPEAAAAPAAAAAGEPAAAVPEPARAAVNGPPAADGGGAEVTPAATGAVAPPPAAPSRRPAAAAPAPEVRIALRDRSDPGAGERPLPKAVPKAGGDRIDLPGGGRLELAGIVWSESNPSALINGRIVGVGERVEGYTVVAISPRQVELRAGTDSLFLQLD